MSLFTFQAPSFPIVRQQRWGCPHLSCATSGSGLKCFHATTCTANPSLLLLPSSPSHPLSLPHLWSCLWWSGSLQVLPCRVDHTHPAAWSGHFQAVIYSWVYVQERTNMIWKKTNLPWNLQNYILGHMKQLRDLANLHERKGEKEEKTLLQQY